MIVSSTQEAYNSYESINSKKVNKTQNETNNFQQTLDDTSNKEDVENMDNKEDIKKLRAMAEDIFSLMKTGFTVSELEFLQELLRELKEKIKDGKYNEEEVEKLLSKIEKEVAAMEKKVTGQAIIESGGDNLKQEDTKTQGGEAEEFLERIDIALTKLKTLESGLIAREDAAKESEILAMIKEFSKSRKS